MCVCACACVCAVSRYCSREDASLSRSKGLIESASQTRSWRNSDGRWKEQNCSFAELSRSNKADADAFRLMFGRWVASRRSSGFDDVEYV